MSLSLMSNKLDGRRTIIRKFLSSRQSNSFWFFITNIIGPYGPVPLLTVMRLKISWYGVNSYAPVTHLNEGVCRWRQVDTGSPWLLPQKSFSAVHCPSRRVRQNDHLMVMTALWLRPLVYPDRSGSMHGHISV